jgi:hypothetical protein
MVELKRPWLKRFVQACQRKRLTKEGEREQGREGQNGEQSEKEQRARGTKCDAENEDEGERCERKKLV